MLKLSFVKRKNFIILILLISIIIIINVQCGVVTPVIGQNEIISTSTPISNLITSSIDSSASSSIEDLDGQKLSADRQRQTMAHVSATLNYNNNVQIRSPLTDNTLFQTIQMLRYLNPKLLVQEYGTAMRGRASWLTCQVCSAAVGLIRLYPSLRTVQTIFVNICSIGYEEYSVCNGLSKLFGEELIYVVTHSQLTNSEVCGIVIGSPCMPSSSHYPYGAKWSVPILPLTQEMKDRLQVNEYRETEKNVSSILHLSDLHLDIYYQVNSPAACSEPLCCRATSTSNKKSYDAGVWGSLDNCDSVLRTIENLLSTISKQHSEHYRYALFTGDYIPHDIWNTTKQEIKQTTRLFNSLVKKHVPNDKIIIPVIGNHESHPVDQFCPSNLCTDDRFSTEWLYDELLNQWNEWIPDEYKDLFRKYGYYTRVDNNKRFIVLNMNYCARLNFWNVLQYRDMGNMLNWLQYELQNATTAGQQVYIVGHIAPDEDECSTHWVLAYRKILQIYKNIIRGQFFGHTHLDEIRIYYTEKKEPISVAYLAPSVTTYFNVYPAFRFYSTDPETGFITDFQTFYLNITKANLADRIQFNPYDKYEPIWDFEYSAIDSYNLTSLQPEAWNEFVTKAIENPELLKRYYQHYGRYDPKQMEVKSLATMIGVLKRSIVQV